MTRIRRTTIIPDSPIMMDIGGLIFKKRGEFVFVGDNLQANICQSGNKERHIVYAHVVDNVVVYIGESSHTFQNRMRLYIIHNGSTNVEVRKHIKEELTKGKKVDIYYYKPKAILIDNVLAVNPYISIEQTLISLLKPILNKKDTAEKAKNH